MNSTVNAGTPGTLFDLEHSGDDVVRTGQVVSLADYRVRRKGPPSEPAGRLVPIHTTGLGISPRQAQHRRRMLQHLAGLTSNF